MNEALQKGIYFDLDTNALKKFYQKGEWHNAYHDIRKYLTAHNFEHIQGSGYHTQSPSSEADTMDIIFSMYQEFQWLPQCVSICIISDIPELYNVSSILSNFTLPPIPGTPDKAAISGKTSMQ